MPESTATRSSRASAKSIRILTMLSTASLVAGFLLFSPFAPVAQADLPKPGQIVVDPENPRWFKYHEGGPFFMAGPGDPEDFLYRGRMTRNGTRRGDQMKLIEKLARSGANSIYLQAVRSHGGDGDSTHNPFIRNDPRKGLNPAVLDQWDEWFTEMDRHGITIFFIFYDDSARIWDTGDRVSDEEREFFHALVDRFEHHRRLIWVVAEEFEERYSWRRASKLAEAIHEADDHGHPVSIHRLSGNDFQQFEGDPYLNQYAMQYNHRSKERLHEAAVQGFREAGGRYNVNLAEAANWGRGAEARQKAWAAAMGGAYVMAFEMDIASTPMEDLEDCGRLKRFMESTDFHFMAPRDDLADLDTEYVLARPGVSYIAYASRGEAFGLRDLDAGRYRLRWLDLRSGHEATNEMVIGGDERRSRMLPRPAGIGSELAVYVRHLDPDPERLAARLPVLERFGTDERGRPVKVASATPAAPAVERRQPSPARAQPAASPPPALSERIHDHQEPATNAPAPNGHQRRSAPALVAEAPGVSGPVERDPASNGDARLASDAGPPLAWEAPSGRRVQIVTPFAAPVEAPTRTAAPAPPVPSVAAAAPNGHDARSKPHPAAASPRGLDVRLASSAGKTPRARVASTGPEAGELLFADDFERPDSDHVGNDWQETESDSRLEAREGRLAVDARDDALRPIAARGFPAQKSGVVVWSFELDFQRTGGEKDYSFWMQLGEGAEMNAGLGRATGEEMGEEHARARRRGVAVNLKWGGTRNGLETHEGLGVVVNGRVQQVATVSGPQTVTVRADLDRRTYDVEVEGVRVAEGVAFDDDVAIDTVRYFADRLNLENFAHRDVDNVTVLALRPATPEEAPASTVADVAAPTADQPPATTLDDAGVETVAARSSAPAAAPSPGL